MKRRNFLKGAAAGIAAPLSIADLLASLPATGTASIDSRPDEPLPDIGGTQFYVDGYRLQSILSVAMTNSVSSEINVTMLDSMVRSPTMSDYCDFNLSALLDESGSEFAYLWGKQKQLDLVDIAFKMNEFSYECQAMILEFSYDLYPSELPNVDMLFRTTSPVILKQRDD